MGEHRVPVACVPVDAGARIAGLVRADADAVVRRWLPRRDEELCSTVPGTTEPEPADDDGGVATAGDAWDAEMMSLSAVLNHRRSSLPLGMETQHRDSMAARASLMRIVSRSRPRKNTLRAATMRDFTSSPPPTPTPPGLEVAAVGVAGTAEGTCDARCDARCDAVAGTELGENNAPDTGAGADESGWPRGDCEQRLACPEPPEW